MQLIITLILLAVGLIAAHNFGIKRHARDHVFGGVCAGIARRFNLLPNLVRALTVIFALVTHGFGLLLYLALWATLSIE